jgi:hypothetical protein
MTTAEPLSARRDRRCRARNGGGIEFFGKRDQRIERLHRRGGGSRRKCAQAPPRRPPKKAAPGRALTRYVRRLPGRMRRQPDNSAPRLRCDKIAVDSVACDDEIKIVNTIILAGKFAGGIELSIDLSYLIYDYLPANLSAVMS